jgi:hypothetical protein
MLWMHEKDPRNSSPKAAYVLSSHIRSGGEVMLDSSGEAPGRIFGAGAEDRSRLDGRRVPSVRLPFVEDGDLDLAAIADRSPLVICIFGAINSGGPCPTDAQRLVNWTRYETALDRSGYRLVAISSESFTRQARWMPLVPSWMIFSDTELLLGRHLPLPTDYDSDIWRYVPATLVTQGTRIIGAFRSVGESDAAVVTSWLTARKPLRTVPITAKRFPRDVGA